MSKDTEIKKINKKSKLLLKCPGLIYGWDEVCRVMEGENRKGVWGHI